MPAYFIILKVCLLILSIMKVIANYQQPVSVDEVLNRPSSEQLNAAILRLKNAQQILTSKLSPAPQAPNEPDPLPMSYDEYILHANYRGLTIPDQVTYETINPPISAEYLAAHERAMQEFRKAEKEYQQAVSNYDKQPDVIEFYKNRNEIKKLENSLYFAQSIAKISDVLLLEESDFGKDDKLTPKAKAQLQSLKVPAGEIAKIEIMRSRLKNITNEVDHLLLNPDLNNKEREALLSTKKSIEGVYAGEDDSYSSKVDSVLSRIDWNIKSSSQHDWSDRITSFFSKCAQLIIAAMPFTKPKWADALKDVNVNAAQEMNRFKGMIKDTKKQVINAAQAQTSELEQVTSQHKLS